MSDHIGRMLRARDRATLQIRDLFSASESFGSTHAYMLERRAEIYARLPKDAPQWVRAYLSGTWEQLQRTAYRYDLVYGGMIEGVFYSTHSDRADYYEKHGISARDYATDGRVQNTGHYWKRTLKPFFTAPHHS